MAVAVKLSNGYVLVPLRLAAGDTVVESSTVHAASQFVVLDPGTEQFTVTGSPRTEKTSTLLRFERITDVAELPAVVATEAEMEELRTRWENVNAFYRRIIDETTSTSVAETVHTLDDMRVIEVDTDKIPPDAAGWTAAPEFLGVPAPLAALVPGTLTGASELIASRVDNRDRRVNVRTPVYREDQVLLTIEFRVAFADARTKWVKKDPFNNRRNAKRIQVSDTKFVQLRQQVPATITADSLDLAHAEVDRIVSAIEAQLSEPVAACATCAGEGLVFTSGVTERRP